MNPSVINIQAIPFEGILRSAYETLNVECIGSLFGERVEKKSGLRWVVEAVQPIQLVKRYPASIKCEDGSVRSTWSYLHEIIGDYHLHPTSTHQIDGVRIRIPGRVELSEEDKKGLTKGAAKDIRVVIGLRKVKREGMLGENPFLASGYIRDEGRIYRFDVGGYYANSRIRRAFIQVPDKILKMFR